MSCITLELDPLNFPASMPPQSFLQWCWKFLQCCCACCTCMTCCLLPCAVQVAYRGLIVFMVMAVIIILYYKIYSPSLPTASLEHRRMYDYLNEDPLVKRNGGDEPEERGPDYNYDVSERETNDYYVKKRDIISTQTDFLSFTNATPGMLDTLRQSSTFSTTHSSNKTEKKSHSTMHMNTSTTPNSTEIEEEDEPDSHLSNIVMDSIYATAGRANITQSLGLCRQNSNIKLPEFQSEIFPVKDANEVLSCMNDLMTKRAKKKRLCIQLDPDMNAYLRWLVLTGDPSVKSKPLKAASKDYFLFPTTPCADEVYTHPDQTSECLVQRGFGEDENSV